MATLLVVVYYSRNISQADYGVYQNFWVHLLLLSAIGMLGIPAFVLTYSAGFVKLLLGTLKRQHYLYIVLWMFLVAVGFAVLQVMDNGIVSYVIPLAFFLFYVFNAVAESMLIVFRQFRFLLLVNVGYTVAFLVLHYGFPADYYSLSILFLYLLIPLGVKCILAVVKVYSSLKSIEVSDEQEYTIADIRSLWRHVGLYDILQKFFTWIDKFVISLLFSASVFAMYFNGTFDVPFLPLLLGAVSSAALLQMASFKKKGDVASTIIIANQTARILSAVVFPLFFFLFVFRHELFAVILANKYEEAVPIFAATVCVVPLRAYNFTSILQNRHKGRIINIGAMLDILVAIALMYPLFQLLGLVGIALSFVISSYVQGGYYLYHTGKVLDTSITRLLPLANWAVKLIVFAILFIAIHYVLVTLFNSQIVLVLGSLLLALVLLITLAIEFKARRNFNGQPISQKKEQG